MQSVTLKAIACMVLSGLSVSAFAETRVFQAIKDNTLFDDNPNYSSGASSFVFTGPIASGSPRRTLWQFDLTTIPSNSQITSATLKFVINRAAIGSNPLDLLRLHKVNASWGEGASDAGTGGGGTQATPEDATWAYRFYGNAISGAGRLPWGALGGDFNPMASATLNAGGAGTYTFASTPELRNNVSAWVNDPSSNFGWIVIGPEGPDQSQKAKRIVSRESPSMDERPLLSVEFTPPPPVTSVPMLTTIGNLLFGFLITVLSYCIARRNSSLH